MKKATEILPRMARGAAPEIIDYLVKTVERFGRPSEDHITFVVKVTETLN